THRGIISGGPAGSGRAGTSFARGPLAFRRKGVPMTSSQVFMAVAAVAALVVVLAISMAVRKRRTRTLADRFGAEYDHALETTGKRTKAEAELEARTKRVENLDIRALTTAERDRY